VGQGRDGGPTHVRRTRYLFFRAADDGPVIGVSVLLGEEVPLDNEELELLRAIPADHWVAFDVAGSAPTVSFLAKHGLIITNGEEPLLRELRRRDELLMSPAWNRYAALFHAFTRWSDVEAVVAGQRPIPTTPDRWPPPPHFHNLNDRRRTELLLTEPARPLYELLRRRKSTRGFDTEALVTLEELSIVLRFVWGCQGTLRIRDELTILKKTSPSGGSQHPGEVYPLIQGVEGVAPGIYHYSVEHHALELIEQLERNDAQELIREFSAGQEHFVAAHVVFLMTARYARNFWKYRAHAKAYRAVLLDAAHLSQTLFLVCADLELGAFVAGAINEQNIDRRLGLQAFAEGTVLMTGCGRSAYSPREPSYVPYLPPRTEMT